MNHADGANVLLIGYGNPGRLDDGLGPALVEILQDRSLPGVDLDADYQLNVEDAAEAARHDIVVFADASTEGDQPFYLKRIQPAAKRVSFSTHSVRPEAVLALAKELFNADTKGYILGIRGYEFNEFGQRLSDRARSNLDKAAAFIEQVIRENHWPDA